MVCQSTRAPDGRWSSCQKDGGLPAGCLAGSTDRNGSAPSITCTTTTRLSKGEFDALIKAFEEDRFFDADEAYEAKSSDNPVLQITLRERSRTKTVRWALGRNDVPSGLQDLRMRIGVVEKEARQP